MSGAAVAWGSPEFRGLDGDGGYRDDAAPKFPLRSLQETLHQPPIEWLVDGVLTAGGFNVLAGFSGSGKSLAAVDVGMSIASGLPWADRAVRRGRVVFVVGEGFRGFGQRLGAWLNYHDVADSEPLPVHFLDGAPQFASQLDVSKALASLDGLPDPPSLIVVDTLAATFLGYSDSRDDELGQWIAGAQQLQRETGAAVLVIHHTGWATERERGSTILRGAVDGLALVTKDDAVVTLSCLKAKDAEPFPDMKFTLTPWGASAILVPVAPGSADRAPNPLPPQRQKALDVLTLLDDGDGVAATKWLETSGLAKATFYRAVADLVSWGLIEKKRGKYSARGGFPG